MSRGKRGLMRIKSCRIGILFQTSHQDWKETNKVERFVDYKCLNRGRANLRFTYFVCFRCRKERMEEGEEKEEEE